MSKETAHPRYDPKPYGYVTLFRRGENSVAFTVPSKAVDDTGLDVGMEFLIVGSDGRLVFTPKPDEDDSYRVGALPDEEEVGDRTLRQDRSSLYFTVPKDGLEYLGLGLNDRAAIRVDSGGTIVLEPW